MFFCFGCSVVVAAVLLRSSSRCCWLEDEVMESGECCFEYHPHTAILYFVLQHILVVYWNLSTTTTTNRGRQMDLQLQKETNQAPGPILY